MEQWAVSDDTASATPWAVPSKNQGSSCMWPRKLWVAIMEQHAEIAGRGGLRGSLGHLHEVHKAYLDVLHTINDAEVLAAILFRSLLLNAGSCLEGGNVYLHRRPGTMRFGCTSKVLVHDEMVRSLLPM